MTLQAAETVVDLFRELRSLGIKLWVEGGDLRFRAPRGALSGELKEAIRVRRDEIVEFLRAAQEGRQVPPIERCDHRERGAPLPLSFSQERLWFLEQWRPEGVAGAAYNIFEAVRLRGTLDRPALARALQDVVDRHEVLRTTFAATGGQPRQVVAPHAGIALAVVDVVFLPSALRAAEARRALTEEAHRPFELERGPLLRATLVGLSDDEHFLVIDLHHIVSDGWSTAVLIRDLVACYEARTASLPPALPPLPVQYADYAVWQRRWLSGDLLDEQLAYWRERLRGAPDTLELPADRPRPPEQSFRGDTLDLTLPAEVCAGLERLSAHGTTRFMLLLAGFAAFLSRLAGVDDLLIGTPIANRRRSELESLIGFFVNTLVMRIELAGRPSFRRLLDRVRETTIGAFAHSDLPFEKLVEELQPLRDKSRTPLVQVMFVLQNTPVSSLAARGLQLEPLALPQRTAKFDLTLIAVDGEPPLQAAFEFSADLFDAATIHRFAGYWQRLLAGAAADPDSAVADLPLLSAAEQEQLALWNATGRDYPRERLLDELIAEQAERTPDAVAVVFEGEALSYADLVRRADRLAADLRALGAGPEVVVGICAERSLELVVGLLAILRSGAAYLPLDPSYPRERLGFMMEDASVPILLTQERLAARLPPHGARLLELETDRPGRGPTAGTERGPAAPRRATDLAYVIFTSGSTGRPKGAMNEHRPIVNRLLWMQEAYGLTPGDRVLQKTPFSFDVSVWEFFWPLLFGARLVVAAPGGHQDPGYLVRTIAEHEVTTLHFVPPMLRAFLEAPGVERCTSLERVVCSGEALPYDLQQRFFARLGGTCCGLHNLYGPTEAAVDVTFWECLPESRRQVVPIGRPVANTAIHLLDRQGNRVPVGVPGELLIGGVQVGRGYLGRPALTAERFVPDPFGEPGARLYRTGDLARRLPGGEVEYLGRIDHQVKVRGFRIELGEVEAALTALPGVRAAVVTAKDSPGGRSLVAYVVASDGALTARELRRKLLESLPEHMVPASFALLDGLPLNPNGKVDRAALARLEVASPAGPATAAAPRTHLEEALAQIWDEVLRLPRVGIHDSFFELGGHSLLATQVVARIEATLGASIPLRLLFEAPRIADLAARVEAALAAGGGTELPPFERAARDRPLPLSYAQERLWLFEQTVPGTAAYNTCRAGHLRGALDLGALAATLDEILRRHEVLRTRYAVGDDGRPVQVIEPHRRLPLPLVDLQALPPEVRQAEVLRRGHLEHNTPISLERTPLVRVAALRLAPDEHVVLLSIHHICYDMWSGNLLLAELEALYLAAAARQPSPLPEPALQYADYAVWQRQWLRGETLEAQRSYWREHLAGRPTIELPTDRPRPASETFRGSSLRFALPGELAAGLRQAAQPAGATQFMSFLAVYAALLQLYVPQPALVIGTAITNRNRQELEGVMGFFENIVALAVDLGEARDAQPLYRDLLSQVREVALGAYAHQHFPFELLAQDLSRAPVLRTTFLFELDHPMMTRTLAGLAMTPYALQPDSAKFELALSLREEAGALVGQVEYNVDLFDAATVRRMVAHYGALLAGVVAEPERPWAELPLLSPAERHQMTIEWNGTEAGAAPLALAPELVAQQVALRPRALAVAGPEGALSYAELEARAARLAGRLRALGVGPESRVGVGARRSPELIAALYAVWRAGGAYVPLDLAAPPARLAHQLADAAVPVVLADGAGRAVLGTLAGVTLIAIDDDGYDAAVPSAPTSPSLVPDNLAYVIYTSGSTGVPKGVEITHRTLLNLIGWHQRTFSLSAGDRTTHLAGLAFDAAVWEVWPTLASGASLHLPDEETRSTPQLLRDWLLASGITVTFLPTPLAESVLALEWPPRAPLRWLLTGGDRLHRFPPPDLPFRLRNDYGPTESTVVATSGTVPPGSGRAGEAMPSIGRAIDGVAVCVADPRLELVPVMAPGELLIGGAGLARGYASQPTATAQRFVPDPWSALPGARLYRTGDLVRWTISGELEFLGRIDHQVKVRGFRIELGEVEAALAAQPAVAACAVLAPELADGSRQLVACVVAAPAADSGTDLALALAERLPGYMVPAAFVWRDSLPLNVNGKVDRLALEAELRAELESPPREAETRPRTLVEEILAGLWTDLLQRPRVGLHDDFFALGGHSLLATQLKSRIRQALGVDLAVAEIFDNATLARLAAAVEGALARHRTAAAALPLARVPHEDGAPLSYAQERMWFLDRLRPGEATYTIPVALRLSGRLDLRALERGVAALVARHETLRTAIVAVDGEPWQSIRPAAASRPDLAVVDLSTLDARLRETAWREQIDAAMALPFDLAQSPLLRVRAWRLGTDEHALLVTMHHIVSDGWSMGIFVRELAQLYEVFQAGHDRAARAESADGMNADDALPPLPIQYADYAIWQRRWLAGPAAVEQLEHWKAALAGAAPCELPLDDSTAASSRGATRAQVLPAGLSAAVRTLGNANAASLFMVLAATLQTLLHRLTGQDDVAVGYPIAGRNQPATEGLIGVFLNTLVLRTRLAQADRFLDLLAKVRQAALDAYANQDVPFERLLEDLQPERDLNRTPFFNVLVNMMSFGARQAAFGGVRAEPIALPETTAKLDLTLYASDDGDRISIDWAYRVDRLSAARVAAMAASLEALLEQVVAAPAAPLAALSLLSDEARSQVLPDPAMVLPLRWDGAIHERFAHACRSFPGRCAVADAQGGWRYAELDAASARLAWALVRRGMGPGSVVAVHADRSTALVWALLGILRAGAAFAILNGRYPDAHLARQVRLASPHGVIRVASAPPPGDELAAALAALPLRADLTLPASLAPLPEELAGLPVEPPRAAVGPHDLAYLAFTSGSTGAPRCIAGPHAPLAHFIDWHGATFGFSPDDRFSMLSGLAHDPLLRDVFTPLSLGATLEVPREEILRQPAALRAWLRERRVTVAHLTPALAQLLALGVDELDVDDRPAVGKESPASGLRFLFTSGEQLMERDVARLRRFMPRVRWVNFYGATETPQGIACHLVDPLDPEVPPRDRPVPIGRGIEGVQLLILSSVDQLAGIGELGEICVRSPYLARGYGGDPAATAERFTPNPLAASAGERIYRTGDLGRYEPDGPVSFVGRRDQQVKIRGYRVEPREIASVLECHPAVDRAVVVAFDVAAEPGEGRRLVAYLVLRSGQAVVDQALSAHLAAQLPSYMVPAHFERLDTLPLTTNGKLDLRALPPPGPRIAQEPTAPRNAVESELAAIWEELFSIRPIGVRESFFALGGHSLLAARLMARIRRRFGRELPLAILFEEPTIERLAAHLGAPWMAREGMLATDVLVAIQPHGTRPPLFCVHPAGGNVLCYAELARRLDPDQPLYGLQMAAEVRAGETIHSLAELYLSEVRRRQERGPFRLAGWSMGGVIAFEMACLLEERGEEVELLALLDAAVPGELEVDEGFLKRAFTADLMLFLGGGHDLRLDLESLPVERWLEELLVAGRAASVLPPETELADLRHHFEVFRSHLSALAAYRPRPYRGSVLLFRAAETLPGAAARPYDLGWGELVDRLEVRDVPGTHYTLLQRSVVEPLAESLRASLDDASRERG